MSITQQQLLQILPNAGPVASMLTPLLSTAMIRFQIVTLLRKAAFLAQIGHESGHLRSRVENLNYSAEALLKTWPPRFDLTTANRLARNPEAIANHVYGGRMGNIAQGDGWKYRGRGLIQITGKNNYRLCGEALGIDLINTPELLEQLQYAALSAAWYWSVNGLNTLADTSDIQTIGSLINTGQRGKVPNGAKERLALYEMALKVLS